MVGLSVEGPAAYHGGFAGNRQGFENAFVGVVGLIGDEPIGRRGRWEFVGADKMAPALC